MTVQSIPARMLSARFHGNQDVRVDEVENLPLCEGEVRIKVAFAGQLRATEGSKACFEVVLTCSFRWRRHLRLGLARGGWLLVRPSC